MKDIIAVRNIILFANEKTAIFCARRKWRKENRHNFTTIKFPIKKDSVTVGNYTYGEIDVRHYSKDNNKLHIGNFCSIGGEVIFMLGNEHPLNHISTYPFITKLITGEEEAVSKGDIIVEDDVWIGQRAIIMSGIKLGQGSVIGAGAVVTKDVPPYAIVGGVPARIIRYRFTQEIISVLLCLDFKEITPEKIIKNRTFFYENINSVEDARRVVFDIQKS